MSPGGVIVATATASAGIIAYRAVAQAHVPPPPQEFTALVVYFAIVGMIGQVSPEFAYFLCFVYAAGLLLNVVGRLGSPTIGGTIAGSGPAGVGTSPSAGPPVSPGNVGGPQR